MSQLRPCPACSRHLRVGEMRCPFCDAALESGTTSATRTTSGVPRLGRAAILALGAAAAAASSMAACTSGSPAPSDASVAEGGGFDAAAGETGGGDTGAADTSLPDTGNVAMPYGAPPRDGLPELV